MRLTQIIEALLFASDAPLTAADLARVDERLDEDTVTAVIDELRSEYDLSERSFQIYEVAGGYQILTRPEFVALLERYDTVPQSSRLSTPALEVLAIIAYRQPLGRVEVEEIRGVQSAAVLRTLQDRGLIEPVGRAEALGRPLLYGTTSKFLDHFGFRSLDDLPRPDELPVVLRTRQVAPAGAEAPAGEPGEGGEAPPETTFAAAEATPAEAQAQPADVEVPAAGMEPALADVDASTVEADATAEETAAAEAGDTHAASASPTATEPILTAAAADEIVEMAAAGEPESASEESADVSDGEPAEAHEDEDEEAEPAAVREG